MTNKRNVVLISFIAGIIGIITGMVGASSYWLGFGDQLAKVAMIAKTESAILSEVALLEQLRSGRYQDATAQLEAQLDADLIGAGALVRNGAELSENVQGALETERRARGMSGYEPENARVGASVQEAFRLVSQPRSGQH